MELPVIIVFILGYVLITIEHNIKIDKLIPALTAMAVCWAIVALNLENGLIHIRINLLMVLLMKL